jgi:ferredoxin hydrogenase large subunit
MKKRSKESPHNHDGFLRIDSEKCVGCRTCVRVCPSDAVKGKFLRRHEIDQSKCIYCAQCLMHCPFGAIKETYSSVEEVRRALEDSGTRTVAIIAPALGAKDLDGSQSLDRALTLIGFDRVMTAEPGAGLTIVDEGCEFVDRLEKKKGPLPLVTAFCPSWVRYAKIFHPEILPHHTKTKPPVVMLGSMIKDYASRKERAHAPKVFTVAIVPCVAKKEEALRPEHSTRYGKDIDAVITTREMTELLSLKLTREGKHESAHSKNSAYRALPKSGGVLAEIIRFAHRKMTRQELKGFSFHRNRGIKEGRLDIKGHTIHTAAFSGLKNKSRIVSMISSEKSPWQLVEILACPGGCGSGGGRPVRKRTLKKVLIRSLFAPVTFYRKIVKLFEKGDR